MHKATVFESLYAELNRETKDIILKDAEGKILTPEEVKYKAFKAIKLVCMSYLIDERNTYAGV